MNETTGNGSGSRKSWLMSFIDSFGGRSRITRIWGCAWAIGYIPQHIKQHCRHFRRHALPFNPSKTGAREDGI